MICYCGNEFSSDNPRRKYCHPYCGSRLRAKKPVSRIRHAATTRQYRHATRGRICKWCGDTDANRYWSHATEECARCKTQKQRRQCPDCGGPEYIGGCNYCLELTDYERLVMRAYKRIV